MYVEVMWFNYINYTINGKLITYADMHNAQGCRLECWLDSKYYLLLFSFSSFDRQKEQ